MVKKFSVEVVFEVVIVTTAMVMVKSEKLDKTMEPWTREMIMVRSRSLLFSLPASLEALRIAIRDCVPRGVLDTDRIQCGLDVTFAFRTVKACS